MTHDNSIINNHYISFHSASPHCPLLFSKTLSRTHNAKREAVLRGKSGEEIEPLSKADQQNVNSLLGDLTTRNTDLRTNVLRRESRRRGVA